MLGRVCICGTSLSLFSWAQSPAKSAKIVQMCRSRSMGKIYIYMYSINVNISLGQKLQVGRPRFVAMISTMPCPQHTMQFQTNTAGRSKQIDCPAVFSQQNGSNSLLQRHLTRSNSLRTMNACTQYISMKSLVCIASL